MKLYFFTTDTGFFEYLFTADEQQAVQTFAIYLVLSKTPASKMWFSEVTPASVGCEHREDLREALSQGIAGFGSYHAEKGWELRPVQARFDELSEAHAEGGVL